MKFTSLVVLIIVLTLTSEGYAQWSTDPNNNLTVGYGLLPELCSDSTGGCYITYEQYTTYPRHLILERLNCYGYKPWETGERLTGLLPEQSGAKITEDGQNGVIVSYIDWEEHGTPDKPIINYRLRVQRVDSSGNFLWGPDGVRVSLSETNQGNQAIISDGAGGCIVAWVDTMGDLRINRINSSGTRVWGDNGQYVWNSPASPPMISDRQGGCYILYGIGRLQRFRQDGTAYWPPQVVLIPTGPWIMHLDQGNIYLFSSSYLGYNGKNLFSIHLQKVDSSGSLLWDSLGVTLDTLNTNYYLTYDFSTQSGYSTIAWPQYTGSVWDLRTQIVRSDGNTVFEYGGIPVSTVVSPKSIVKVLPSDSSTSLYVWFDERSLRGTYAQRLDTLGNQFWDTTDILVSLPELSYEHAITDGSGGFIIAGSRENFSIRAQQVSKYGNLGEVITSIKNENFQSPQEYILFQNYPNPFNASTVIRYEIAQSNFITIEVFNLLGQQVQTVAQRFHNPGVYSVNFSGEFLPSGIYFYKMHTDRFVDLKKMLLVK
jgi:hypothetical protein